MTPELLAALRAAGLAIERQSHCRDEWFVAGELGPFHSSEAALIAGVHWLRRLHADAREEVDELYTTRLEAEQRAAEFEEEAKALRTALAAAQAELRAERKARNE